MTHPPGRSRWRRYATKMLVTGLVLAGAAGCSSSPAVTRNSVTSCYQVAATAIQRHVTLTAMPAACQGLSQLEVNQAVSRALRAAAAGVRGKVRQRELIGDEFLDPVSTNTDHHEQRRFSRQAGLLQVHAVRIQVHVALRDGPLTLGAVLHLPFLAQPQDALR